jgi:2-polyprenyl-3-methyl-5-hydroxy-6-metoxy-1,4-benzoquinol methylase
MEYLEKNKALWNARTETHFDSEFYDNKSFLNGRNSLHSIELAMLGDVDGKSILHLQCHFGQDSISLARMGAEVTGMDFSEAAIEKAKDLNHAAKTKTTFICSDVYDLPNHLTKKFDIVFTTYGVIGWLPDMTAWAGVISHFLKPGGRLVFAEFHPVVWMFDNDFQNVLYSYFNKTSIIETESGTYTNRNANIHLESVSWNHSIMEVVNSLIASSLTIEQLNEYDYSPHNCFKNMVEIEKNKFQIRYLENKLPLVYGICARKV